MQISVINYSVYKLNICDKGVVLFAGTVITALISYLFYRSVLIFGVAVVPAVYITYRLYTRYRIRRRRDRLACEFEEMLQSVSVAISTGYSVENAFEETYTELALMFPPEAPVMIELGWICASIRLNITVEEIIMNLAQRSGIEDIYSFAEILTIAKRSGGDLVMIVRQTADIMHGKKEINEDIRTMITARKYENRIMSVMPAGMLVYLQICSPGYLSVLYGNASGVCIMTICLAIYMISFFIGNKIMNIDISVKCRRPLYRDGRGNKRSVCSSRIFRLITNGYLSKWAKDISEKIKTIYIDKLEMNIIGMFWDKLSRTTGLAVAAGGALLVYGILNDDGRLPYLVLIAVALVIGIPVGRIKQLDRILKNRDRQMLMDYPDLISRFTLLLGAGVNMRGTWERIVRDYDRKRGSSQIAMHYIYEEMRYGMNELQNGMSERSVYEKFGRRLKLMPYMKFSTMLTQNLRKGNRSLLDQLKLTSFDALEQRREAMKRLGEEASSKLLFPMIIQFMLILTIIMYPALVTL